MRSTKVAGDILSHKVSAVHGSTSSGLGCGSSPAWPVVVTVPDCEALSG